MSRSSRPSTRLLPPCLALGSCDDLTRPALSSRAVADLVEDPIFYPQEARNDGEKNPVEGHLPEQPPYAGEDGHQEPPFRAGGGCSGAEPSTPALSTTDSNLLGSRRPSHAKGTLA